MIDLRDPAVTAAQVIAALGLSPHPEGGHYREIWRDAPKGGGRGAGTAIYFLLAAPLMAMMRKPFISGPVFPAISAPLPWCRRAGGKALSPLAAGPLSAAPSAPPLISPDLNWRRPIGAPPRGEAHEHQSRLG